MPEERLNYLSILSLENIIKYYKIVIKGGIEEDIAKNLEKKYCDMRRQLMHMSFFCTW